MGGDIPDLRMQQTKNVIFFFFLPRGIQSRIFLRANHECLYIQKESAASDLFENEIPPIFFSSSSSSSYKYIFFWLYPLGNVRHSTVGDQQEKKERRSLGLLVRVRAAGAL